MKLMDLICTQCGCQSEDFVESDAKIGDIVKSPCLDCGNVEDHRILPCAPDLRTPMNSVSFLDGHRDGGDAWKHQIRYKEAQLKFNRQKQGQGTLSASEAGAAAQEMTEMGRNAT